MTEEELKRLEERASDICPADFNQQLRKLIAAYRLLNSQVPKLVRIERAPEPGGKVGG